MHFRETRPQSSLGVSTVLGTNEAEARGLAQHGGPTVGWRRVTQQGVILYMPPALADHATCPGLLLNVRKAPS
jgi:hypothetical protein